MNLLAIVIANSIGIFLALSVLRISYMDRRGNDPDSRLLTALLVICFSCCLMEMLSFLVDGKASDFCAAMVWITNTWLFLGNPLFSTLWLLYVDYHLYKKEKRLTTKELDLLYLLFEYKNRVVERPLALKRVWHSDNYFNARNMDVYVKRLRKLLCEDPSVKLENVHGVGYKLVIEAV